MSAHTALLAPGFVIEYFKAFGLTLEQARQAAERYIAHAPDPAWMESDNDEEDNQWLDAP